MNFKLSKTARMLKISDKKIIVAVGSGQFICEESGKILALCSYLKEEKNKEELDDFALKNDINSDLIEKLILSNIITTNATLFESKNLPEFKNWLYLDVLYNENSKKIQDELANCNFIIVGTGNWHLHGLYPSLLWGQKACFD